MGVGYMIMNLGFRVGGLRFIVYIIKFMVLESRTGIRVQGLGIWGLGLRV